MKLKQPSILLLSMFFLAFLLFLNKTYGANNQSGMDEKTKARYKAASPFNHNVKITRTGSVLKFDYELIGADGKTYDLWKINDQSKPVISIYQGDRKLDSGKFKFG